jgi:hypothetical protein
MRKREAPKRRAPHIRRGPNDFSKHFAHEQRRNRLSGPHESVIVRAAGWVIVLAACTAIFWALAPREWLWYLHLIG